MLKILTRVRRVRLADAERNELIANLDGAEQTAVVRAMRARCFELSGVNKDAAKHVATNKTGETKQSGEVSDVADATERRLFPKRDLDVDSYTHGEIFVAPAHALFLVFDQARDEHQTDAATANVQRQHLRVGCIFDINAERTNAQADHAATLLKRFCARIDEQLARLHAEDSDRTGASQEAIESESSWQTDTDFSASATWQRLRGLRDSLNSPDRVDNGQDATVERAAPQQPTLQDERAVEVLGDADVRRWLRRLRESRQENRPRETNGSQSGAQNSNETASNKPQPELMTRMRDAGLINAEIVVSCREAKRALFRLPSSAALAAITATNAACSECGALIGDEKIEEHGAPTPLAFSLLDGGAWLGQHIRTSLAGYGIDLAEDLIAPDQSDGSDVNSFAAMRLLVNYCGEMLLIVARDGDFTAAHSQRAIDSLIELDAARLLVVATGEITPDAHARLRSYDESTHAATPLETFFAEGTPAIKSALERALTHCAQDALRRSLAALNADLGFPANALIEAKFGSIAKSGDRKEVSVERATESNGNMLSDIAESAVGAVAGRLGSF